LAHTPFVTLAAAAREGDRLALGKLFDGFRSYLYLLADRRLGLELKRKCACSDLVQQTFLEAQQAFPQFEGSEPEQLRVWLERILLNNLCDATRRFREVEKRQLTREVSLSATEAGSALIDQSTPSKVAVAREVDETVRVALTRIPEEYRRVIVQRNLERQSFGAIALELGRSADAVKKLWSRAILRLKEELKEHERP
jgi:RNA polymerase sigma-70 factor (ECF subfamily)